MNGNSGTLSVDVGEAKEFLNILWRGKLKGNIIIGNAPPGKKWTNYTLENIDDLDNLLADAPEGNVYFSVVSRDGDSRNDPAVFMPGLWLDLDFKTERKPDGIAESQVSTFIEKLEHKPTVTVNTGNGIHLYWLFDDVIDISENEQYMYGLSVWWHRQLVAIATDMKFRVDSTFDIKRVLRLPGFTNFKFKPYAHVSVGTYNPTYLAFDEIADQFDTYSDNVPEGGSFGALNAANLIEQPRAQSFQGGVTIYVGDDPVLTLTDADVAASPPMSKINNALDSSHDFRTIWYSKEYASPSERDFALSMVMHKMFFTPQEMAATFNHLRKSRHETPDKTHAHALTIVKSKIDDEKNTRMMSMDKEDAFAALSYDLFQHELSTGIANIVDIIRYETGEIPLYVISVEVDGEIFKVKLNGSRKLLEYREFRIAMTDSIPPRAASYLQTAYKNFVWAGHSSMMLLHTVVEEVPLSQTEEEIIYWFKSFKEAHQVSYPDDWKQEGRRDSAIQSMLNGTSLFLNNAGYLWFNEPAFRKHVREKFDERISSKAMKLKLKQAGIESASISYVNKGRNTSSRAHRIKLDILGE